MHFQLKRLLKFFTYTNDIIFVHNFNIYHHLKNQQLAYIEIFKHVVNLRDKAIRGIITPSPVKSNHNSLHYKTCLTKTKFARNHYCHFCAI